MSTYDMMTTTYHELSFVQVQHASLSTGNYVFHAFASREAPFDTVELRRLTVEFEIEHQSLMVCPVADATFEIRINTGGRGGRLVRTIDTES